MSASDVKARIDAIEESYEFFLAYAAQGLTSDHGSASGGDLREYLRRTHEALDGLADAFRSIVEAQAPSDADAYLALIDVLAEDAAKAAAAVRLVRAQPAVSSQLIDNLNATIHIRALLTDIFLLDEALDGSASDGSASDEAGGG